MCSSASATAASQKPKNPLPTSPMKILAGGQFHARKPKQAPAVTTGRSSQGEEASRSAAIRSAVAAETNAACDPAIPSMPSMKLKRLMLHRTPTARANMATQRGSCENTGTSELTPRRRVTVTTLAVKCTASRGKTASPFRSSQNPTAATMPPPITSAGYADRGQLSKKRSNHGRHQHRQYDAQAAAAWRGPGVRTAHVRDVQQPSRNSMTPYQPSDGGGCNKCCQKQHELTQQHSHAPDTK